MQIETQTDHGASRPPRAGQRSAGWWGRRLTGVVLVAALAVPGAAFASGAASSGASPRAMSADMIAGATEFAGTHPVCRTIVAGAKYRCTISGGAPYYNLPTLTHAEQTQLTLVPPGEKPPYSASADRAYQEQLLEGWGWTPVQAREYASGRAPDIDAGDFDGVNEPTIDAVTHRVNGGCDALNATGSQWECYLGQAALRAHEVSPHFLGKKVNSPIAK